MPASRLQPYIIVEPWNNGMLYWIRRGFWEREPHYATEQKTDPLSHVIIVSSVRWWYLSHVRFDS